MLPDSVRTSSELLQPSISHPSLSTHIFWHESSSADAGGRGKRNAKVEKRVEFGDGLVVQQRGCCLECWSAGASVDGVMFYQQCAVTDELCASRSAH